MLYASECYFLLVLIGCHLNIVTLFESGTGRVPDQLVNLDMKHGVEAKNYEEVILISPRVCDRSIGFFLSHILFYVKFTLWQ